MEYCENTPEMPTAMILKIFYGKTPKTTKKNYNTKQVRLLKWLYHISEKVTKGHKNPMGKIIPDIRYSKFLVNLLIVTKFLHFSKWIFKKENAFGLLQVQHLPPN